MYDLSGITAPSGILIIMFIGYVLGMLLGILVSWCCQIFGGTMSQTFEAVIEGVDE